MRRATLRYVTNKERILLQTRNSRVGEIKQGQQPSHTSHKPDPGCHFQTQGLTYVFGTVIDDPVLTKAVAFHCLDSASTDLAHKSVWMITVKAS